MAADLPDHETKRIRLELIRLGLRPHQVENYLAKRVVVEPDGAKQTRSPTFIPARPFVQLTKTKRQS